MQPPRPCLLLLGSLLALPGRPLAQGSLVIDLKPGGGFPGSGFWTGESLALGDELLFAGDDGGGTDLWITDGTAAGTHLVHDVYPGDGSSPREFTALGDQAVFAARVPLGESVWRTDGTSAGTVELTPPAPLGYGLLTSFQGAVWFVETGSPTPQLWRTDGTPAGTAALVSIPAPAELIPFGPELFFSVGHTGAFGFWELWRTDGTAAGTALVQTFPHPLAEPRDFTVLGDALFFSVLDFASGRELWRSDGTAAGTALFADLTPGTASTSPEHLQVVDGGHLLFADFVGLFGPARRLWTSDGTVAGTQVLFSDSLLEVLEVASVGPRAYFFAAPELWVTDGTPAGTHFVDDDVLYKVGAPEPLHLGSGDELVFRGWEGEPWVADLEHAARLADVHPGSAGSNCNTFRRAGSRLFFGADDGTTGQEVHAIPLAQAGAWVGAPFGAGCGAGASPPLLSLSGAAVLGGAAQVELSGAAPSAAAVLFWSPERGVLDLGGGCTVYLAPPQALLHHATGAAGSFALALAIPDAPALLGLTLYLQELIAAPGGPLLGVGELSSGLEVVLGP